MSRVIKVTFMRDSKYEETKSRRLSPRDEGCSHFGRDESHWNVMAITHQIPGSPELCSGNRLTIFRSRYAPHQESLAIARKL